MGNVLQGRFCFGRVSNISVYKCSMLLGQMHSLLGCSSQAQSSAQHTYSWFRTVSLKAGVSTSCPTFTVLEEYLV